MAMKCTDILIIYWDVETIGFGGEAVCSQWCYSYGNATENAPLFYEGYSCIENNFREIKDLWISLGSPKIRLYAHNAAFDLMRTKIQLEGSNFKAVMVQGAMIAAKLEWDGMEIECRDSLRLLSSPLSDLADSLCPELPKLEMNHLVGYIQGDPKCQDYAKRDVVSLRGVLKSYAKLINEPVDKLKFTASGQSLYLFKKLFELDNGKYRPANKDFNQKIVMYYYNGGRIFIRNGHSPIEIMTCVSLDITSSYPYQMREQKFPKPGVSPNEQRSIPKNVGRYFVHVKVTDYDNLLPVLPYRECYEDIGRTGVLYPHGTFESYITDMEYEWVLKNQPNTKIEVLWCISWHKKDCTHWLRPYINEYYGLKEKGDEMNKIVPKSGEALRTVGKLQCNGLYGKFAQKYVEGDGETTMWGDATMLQVFGESGLDHRNAHISAFITGGARCALYDAIIFFGVENIVMCDTDSVKIYEHVYKSKGKMPNEGSKLGEWKNEGTYKDLQVIAPKVYIGVHDGKLEIKCKGLPMSGIAHITVDGITTTYKRSKVCLDQNKEVDKKYMLLIATAARKLSPTFVGYAKKPTKLKTFTRTGVMAIEGTKQMSTPYNVKGMDYVDGRYKIPVISR